MLTKVRTLHRNGISRGRDFRSTSNFLLPYGPSCGNNYRISEQSGTIFTTQHLQPLHTYHQSIGEWEFHRVIQQIELESWIQNLPSYEANTASTGYPVISAIEAQLHNPLHHWGPII